MLIILCTELWFADIFCHRNKEGDDKILASHSAALRYTELKVCDEVVEERGKVVQCDVTNLNE